MAKQKEQSEQDAEQDRVIEDAKAEVERLLAEFGPRRAHAFLSSFVVNLSENDQKKMSETIRRVRRLKNEKNKELFW